MKVLILGANGMIGRTMFKVLADHPDWKVIGSIRATKYDFQSPGPVYGGSDLTNSDHLRSLFHKANPDVVVNCAGLTKHVSIGNDPIRALTMNALLPNRLVELCGLTGARLIHVSTDCIFSGRKGNYIESDQADATDLYGKTKALGEVIGENVITLRTSTIGPEHETKFGLLEWFLAQQECKGFRHAIFSGLPTVEFARVVRDLVIPNTFLSGIYHVGASAIDKLSLLQLINKVYQRNINIFPEEAFYIDRSLNCNKFADATGYRAASWPELIDAMYQDHLFRK